MTDPTDELERSLAAYADARLAPDPRSIVAMRARVVRDAEFAFAATREAAAERAGRVARRRARWRRLGSRYGLVAAVLTLSIAFAGVTLASEAGDPLYRLRVWLETATLPAGGDARTTAEIDRLDARVVELEAAVQSGNGHGAAAAAAAYQAIVDEAVLGAAGNGRRQMQLGDALARHVEVLTGLLETVPASAREAVVHAIGESGKAIEKIGDPATDPDGGQGTGKPGKTPKPDKSPRPGDSQGSPGS